ncbi:MAG: helix-turn-helix transcriptional regulator [Lachnospiraceae bacterium]|nr:helix-turn-helix transcriptional regulator [Lachnospiraceae bacterium]
MAKKPLPKEENIYETDCPILFAMDLIGQKWKLPILWYIADAENQTLRYRELERKVVGITATMLTKCLRELEQDRTLRPAVQVRPVQVRSMPDRVFSASVMIALTSAPTMSRPTASIFLTSWMP